jgi:GrpB-like predicted nucleotidyltransferase (UPF0157 family)
MRSTPPQAPISLVPYDPAWPLAFERERAFLDQLLASWRKGPIEHVGSTAVPGLLAKPVIDVMVGVASLLESVPAKDVLEQAGYCYAEYKTDVMHWFCKPSFAHRTHHLHLIPYESPLWHERLAFRDLLRSNPLIAQQYADLKTKLAQTYEFDREGYTDSKYPFIRRVLDESGGMGNSRSSGE